MKPSTWLPKVELHKRKMFSLIILCSKELKIRASDLTIESKNIFRRSGVSDARILSHFSFF